MEGAGVVLPEPVSAAYAIPASGITDEIMRNRVSLM
jgi:hypothetical protein